jgi:hypothetical protein
MVSLRYKLLDDHEYQAYESSIKKISSRIPTQIENISGHIIVYNEDHIAKPHHDEYEYTAVTLLNDDYEGGELIVGNTIYDLERGETIIFEGKQSHCVMPIESGTRKVFVLWFNRNE